MTEYMHELTLFADGTYEIAYMGGKIGTLTRDPDTSAFEFVFNDKWLTYWGKSDTLHGIREKIDDTILKVESLRMDHWLY